MHRNGIFHRDLKPENILINADYRVKLIDFGVARRFRDNCEPFYGIVGTRYYTAPEIYIDEPYHPDEFEVWALGIILFEMKTRTRPCSSDILIENQGDGKG